MMTSRQIPNTDSGTIVCSSTTFTKFIQDIDIEAIRALKRVGTYGHSQEILMSTWFKRASAFKKEVISLLGLPAGNKELVFDRAEYQAFCKEFQELLSKVEKPEYLDAADLPSISRPETERNTAFGGHTYARIVPLAILFAVRHRILNLRRREDSSAPESKSRVERYVQEQANNPDLDSFDDLYHAFLSAWDDLSRRIEQERRMDKGSIGKMRKEQGLLAYELMSLFNALPKDQTCSESFSSVVRRNHSYAETSIENRQKEPELYFPLIASALVAHPPFPVRSSVPGTSSGPPGELQSGSGHTQQSIAHAHLLSKRKRPLYNF